MSSYYEYWLHNLDNQPVAGPFDTVNEALEASTPDPDEPTAVIEYEFEYADSSLVDPRFDTWPPPEMVRDNIERTCCDDPECPIWGDEYLVPDRGQRVV